MADRGAAGSLALGEDVRRVPGSPPKILVLLATHNGVRWIEEQVSSILMQQEVEVHLVVGDDCSKDGTAAVIGHRWGADSRVELHAWHTASGSAGANFRRLFVQSDASRFDFVALADQDDIWNGYKLAAASEALLASDASGYSCSVTSFWPNGRQRLQRQSWNIRRADFLFEGAGQGCTFVMRADFFARVAQFLREQAQLAEALHYHDWLVYLLARVWCLEWLFDSRAWMQYRQHGGNEIGSRGGVGSIRRRLTLIRNGWYKRQLQAAMNIVAVTAFSDHRLDRYIALCSEPDSVFNRARRCKFVLSHSRRRLADRLIVTAAVALGWV